MNPYLLHFTLLKYNYITRWKYLDHSYICYEVPSVRLLKHFPIWKCLVELEILTTLRSKQRHSAEYKSVECALGRFIMEYNHLSDSKFIQLGGDQSDSTELKCVCVCNENERAVSNWYPNIPPPVLEIRSTPNRHERLGVIKLERYWCREGTMQKRRA